MKLSSLAQHLAEHIAAAPHQKVEFETLYVAAVRFDRSLATAPTARSEIRAALDELVNAKLVLVPGAKQHFDQRDDTCLPMWVKRPPRSRVDRKTVAERVWPAALEAAGQIASRADEISTLETVTAFLRDGGGDRPSVPMRERSLELFGDEKQLDRLAKSRLFTSGAMTLDLLRCHPVPIPFVSQWVPGTGDPHGTALLIAENHHTYTSLLEITRHNANAGGPGRHVGYGTGGQFPSAVLSVLLLVPQPDRIVYFGDVDLKGLQIPATANATATLAGLPAVTPALPLYQLLFELNRERPATAVSADIAVGAAAWLGPLALRARDVLTGGVRLPQEAVGYEPLMAHRSSIDRV